MPYARKPGMAGVIIAIVLALCAAGGGTVYAAQDSLPGDTLYQVKLGSEQAMMWVGDDVVKAERALSFAERRVREMEALAEKGRSQDLVLAVEKYGYAVSTAVGEMKRARSRGPDAENITARVAEVMARHLVVFDQLWDIVPEEAKVAIAYARDVSETGWEDSLVALAMSDPMHAAEMDLAAMDGRLNRVRTMVQDPEALQIALQQFGDMAVLVQEISQIALTENFIVVNGYVFTDHMARYRMPSIFNTPEITSFIVEHPVAEGPYGAKGVGELSAFLPPPRLPTRYTMRSECVSKTCQWIKPRSSHRLSADPL